MIDKYCFKVFSMGMNVLPRPALMLATTLAFLAAQLLTNLIHEVLGHGLAALAVGGHLYAFFVNIFGGRAYLWIPPEAELWQRNLVNGAGIGANLLACAFFWVLLKRNIFTQFRIHFLMNAGCNGVAATLYVGMDSLLFIFGQTEGDVAQMLASQPLAAVPASIVGISCTYGILRAFCRDILTTMGGAGISDKAAQWRLLASFVGPGILFNLAALTIAWPFMSAFYVQGSAFSLILFLGLFFAVGYRVLPLLTVRHDDNQGPARDSGYVTRVILVGLIAMTFYFGPTDLLTHNVILKVPGAEFFPGYVVKVNLRIYISSKVEARAGLCATSVPRNGSALEQRLAHFLNLAGPDPVKNKQVQKNLAKIFLGAKASPLGDAQLTEGCWDSQIRLDFQDGAILADDSDQSSQFSISIPESDIAYLQRVVIRIAPNAFRIWSSNGVVNGDAVEWSKEKIVQHRGKLELKLLPL